MIRYSHVSLLVSCNTAAEAADVTASLGVQTNRVRENKTYSWSKESGRAEKISYSWMLDSPMSQTDGDPTARLYALADIIEPFASRLPSLRPRFRPWIDIIYHITPQHPHGVTGEFEWFRVPAELMRRYSAWDLDISYESFWFDHPDWARSQQRGWWNKFIESIRRRRSNQSDTPPAKSQSPAH